MSRESTIQIATPDGFILEGELVTPSSSQHGCAVLSHGINSHRQEYLDMFPILASKLSDMGWASLRFDFRGHGDSEGTSLDFSVIGQIIDLRSVVSKIRNDFDWRGQPLGFVGVSFGGGAGVLWDASEDVFTKLALFAPVLSYRATFLEPTTPWGWKNFSSVALESANSKGYVLVDDEFKLSARLLEEMRLLDPEKALQANAHKALVIHGTADSLVPCDVTAALSSRYPEITVDIVHGMEHGLYYEGDPDGQTDGSKALLESKLDEIARHVVLA